MRSGYVNSRWAILDRSGGHWQSSGNAATEVLMPSPFPGMDPFLEDRDLWPSFHHTLIACLRDLLQPGLTGAYEGRIGERCYAVEGTQPGSVRAGEQREPFIEICRGGQLVTLLEVVSPANKTTASGRQAYRDKRREARSAGAGVVEIDLVLQGRPMLEYSRANLPDWDYAVTVARSTSPDRYEIYTATAQKRLPRFRLPMASDDRDTVLDLQAAFNRCYDQAGFAERIDYRRGPTPELVALVAYSLWQREGCTHGRDKEHWYRAEELLKNPSGRE